MEAIQFVDTMQYDKDFQKVAGWLAHGDRFLAEELRSEMHLGVMRMAAGKDRSIYMAVARWRAIDFIRSRKYHYSDRNVIKHVSLQAIRMTGHQIDTAGSIYPPKSDNSIDMEG